MTKVVIAVGDQGLAQQIQTSLIELGGVDVVAIATTSTDLTQAMLREDADVALVHEALGPDPVLPLIRDLAVRRPGTALLLVATDASTDTLAQAMEAGARGLVALPLSFGQLQARLRSAADHAAQMRRILAAEPANAGEDRGGRARTVAFAGSKGGVGVTTLLTHIAVDLARTSPGLEICLIDMDLEKADIPALLEVRHRLGIGDLAKVADDLSPGTLADAITRHASGVDLLLAPVDIRDVEAVTPTSLRQVMAGLRQEYDVLLVDLGSHVTPAQATVVELCDEVVLVVTPDVASLRGMRRTINAWESLGVTKESEIRILVNRVSRQVTVSMATVRQLTKAAVVATGVPASFARLEVALNARDPLELRQSAWWATLRQIGRDIGMVPARYAAARQAQRSAPQTPDPRNPPVDSGSIALESLAMLPLFGVIAGVVWHLAMFGAGAVLQANAAATAARAASIGADPQQAAQDSLGGLFADDITVTGGGSQVTVTMQIPGVVAGFPPGIPTSLTTTRTVVEEP